VSRVHVLEREQIVPRPRSEVFAFFEDAANLERMTPPFLHFRVLTPPPIVMSPGTLIDYRIRLFGAPLRWRTKIESYQPGVRFIDAQLRGPYKSWRHLHEFSDVPGGTRMTDRVEYEMPFGPLGTVARALFVKLTLGRIFDFRREVIASLYPATTSS